MGSNTVKCKKETSKCHVKVGSYYYETKINDVDIVANVCNRKKLIALASGEYIKGSLVEEIKYLEE